MLLLKGSLARARTVFEDILHDAEEAGEDGPSPATVRRCRQGLLSIELVRGEYDDVRRAIEKIPEAGRMRGDRMLLARSLIRRGSYETAMQQLEKIHRIAGRQIPGAPHEVLLVLDATTGQNALEQARVFSEGVGVTGLVLTKLDGTAKGGVIVGLADAFGIPVKHVGVGESVEDLRDFSADDFVDALFD